TTARRTRRRRSAAHRRPKEEVGRRAMWTPTLAASPLRCPQGGPGSRLEAARRRSRGPPRLRLGSSVHDETAGATREEARAKGIKWLVTADCSGSPLQSRTYRPQFP